MIRNLIDSVFRTKNKLSERIFEPKIFISDKHQKLLQAQGYVHLNNIVEDTTINNLINIFNLSIDKFNFTNSNPNFLNTMALKDDKAKHFIRTETLAIVENIISQILIQEKITIPFGGAFCINPPQALQSCNPHQDPAYVDEQKSYSLIVWIPLEDINLQNGCLHVLPKSHLWGNYNRSISMDWAFEPYGTEIWKHLIPIETKKGDVIIFDAALIHASNINTSNSNRLAINIPVLPKSEQMITYFKINKNTGYKCDIDSLYYLDELLFNKPSDKYQNKKMILLNNYYSIENLQDLIKYSKI